jgi:hypothetical protein
MPPPPRKPWLVRCTLHRKLALSPEERADLAAYVARWGTHWALAPWQLDIPEGAVGILAAGTMTLSSIPDDPDAQRFMRALKELRGVVPDTLLRIAGRDGPKISWSGKYQLYSFNPFSTWRTSSD